jgi:hypothetical protein
MTRLRRAIGRFFSRLAGLRKPTPGAIARMRLQEFRRDSSRRWEINPGAPEIEASLDLTSGPVFRDESVDGATEQAAGRIRISVSRIRFR